MYSVLLDTNVLLDYHLGRGPRAKQCAEIISRLLDSGSVVAVTSLSLKDEFYLIAKTLKQQAALEDACLDESARQAIDEIAWACIRQIVQLMQVIDVGYGDCLRAETLRVIHGDFEDNLIAAAGERAKVDYLVTSDKKLLRHAALRCLTPGEMLALLDAESSRV